MTGQKYRWIVEKDWKKPMKNGLPEVLLAIDNYK